MSFVAEDKLWCPVRALKWYLEEDRGFPGDNHKFIYPTMCAVLKSIKRHIIKVADTVEVMRRFAIDTRSVRAIEFRGVATSTALFAEV